MIRSTFLSVLLIVGLDFAQSTWFEAISILGVIPDPALLLVVWTAYRNGPIVGSAAGFVSGVALDCISAAPLGFSAFVRSIAAWLASLLHGSFSIDRFFLPFLMGALSTLVKALSTGIIHILFGDMVRAYNFLSPDLWIEVGYNGVIAPVAFFLFSLGKRILSGGTDR